MSCAAIGVRPAAAAGALDDLRLLERRSGGRLGVYAFRPGLMPIAYRAYERFAMCSTFKLPLVAAVLFRVDRGLESVDRSIVFGKPDLLPYAPVAKQHLARGWMSVATMCRAAIAYSDNTAANLLLRTIGGPTGFNRFIRSLGDSTTRLDRDEPALNSAIPGDRRDTTTPTAMAHDAHRLLFGNALSAESRGRLTGWLRECRTGLTCLRAGLPQEWAAGDKTGSGGPVNARGAGSTRNDVAAAWPPGRPPVAIAAYLTETTLGEEARDGVLAAVGSLVARALA